MNSAILLEEASLYAKRIVSDYSDRIVYHDIKFARRLISAIENMGAKSDMTETELDLAKTIGWFYSCGYYHLKVKADKNSFTSNNIESSLETVAGFFEKQEYSNEIEDTIKSAISCLVFPYSPKNQVENLVADSILLELMSGKNNKHLKAYYQEWLLHDVSLGKSGWLDLSIEQVSRFEFHNESCKEELLQTQVEVIRGLRKEKKSLEVRSDLVLKKELDISDAELKELKKNLAKTKGRDDRGIQTLFRTMSKNHYTLNQMVDTKASIMITVNSIILSLILGGIIGDEAVHHTAKIFPVIALLFTSIISIIYAILSIRPNLTQGKFSEEQIRNKEGNLLYFGNFHDMHLRDYQWGVLQMLSDSDYLYSSIVRDIYFLGKSLNVKYKFLRKSLNIFLFGLITVIILYLIVNFVFDDVTFEHH